MNVECPGCNTSFPVDPDKVPDGGIHARCSVCQEVFLVEGPGAEAEPAPAAEEMESAPPGLPSLDEPPVEDEIAEEEIITAEEPLPTLEADEEPPLEEPLPTLEAEEEEESVTEEVEVVEEEVALGEEEPVADAEEGPVFGTASLEEAEAGVEPTFGDPEPTLEELPEMDAPDAADPTFGDGETTFSMDGPDLAAEAPTFDSPTPDLSVDQTFSEGVTAEEPMVEEAPAVEEGPSFGQPEEEREISFDEPTFEAPSEEPAPEAPTEPAVETPLPTPSFGKRDPKEKAQRLARVLVSDIILYNPDRHHKALDAGTLKEDFQEEIEKSWSEYVEQVGDEIANSTNFFNEALNDILAKGQEIF